MCYNGVGKLSLPLRQFILSPMKVGLFFCGGDTIQASQARLYGAELSIHLGFICIAVAIE